MGGRNTYLKRDGGRWIWRRRVPQKLIARFGRAELIKSIGHMPYAEALRRARNLTVRSDELFDQVQNRPNLTPDEIAELARDFFERRLQGMETARTQYQPEDPDDLDQLEKRAQKRAYGARELLRINDLGVAAEPAHGLLEHHGIQLDPDSPAMIELQRAILRANAEAHRINVARMGGDYGAMPSDPLLTAAPSTTRMQTPPSQPEVKRNSPLFSAAWQRYASEKIAGDAWADEMQRDQQATLDLAVEIIGDPPIDEIGRPMISDFVAKLQQLPRNRAKDRRYRGKPVRKVLQLVDKDASVARLSPTTVNKHAGAVSSFFEWAVRQGYVDVNPAKGVYRKPKTRKRRREEREAWSDEQLRMLFTSPIWQGSHHWFRMEPGDQVIRDNKFWLPILGAFQGLRLEEAAQLRISDIKREGDVWLLDINAERDDVPGPNKKLKSPACWRRVPLHKEVLKLGFVEWVQDRRRQGTLLCFSELKPYGAGKRYGAGFSKDFGRLVRKLGLSECTFHSLRHSAITALVRAEVHQDVIDQLDGHETDGERGRYTKRLPLEQLKRAVDKIAYNGVNANVIAGSQDVRGQTRQP